LGFGVLIVLRALNKNQELASFMKECQDTSMDTPDNKTNIHTRTDDDDNYKNNNKDGEYKTTVPISVPEEAGTSPEDDDDSDSEYPSSTNKMDSLLVGATDICTDYTEYFHFANAGIQLWRSDISIGKRDGMSSNLPECRPVAISRLTPKINLLGNTRLDTGRSFSNHLLRDLNVFGIYISPGGIESGSIIGGNL
jgi:hypothetical protein